MSADLERRGHRANCFVASFLADQPFFALARFKKKLSCLGHGGTMRHYILLIAALSLTGCAGVVETARMSHRYEVDTAVRGVSYALPMLQYDLSITHTLKSCGSPGDVAAGVRATSFGFDTKIEPTPRYVPDERFNVDYRKLSGLFRTSTFTIEYYPNGTIKSIGAASDDKTGEAIKSAAKLAGGVIALTGGRPEGALDIKEKDGANKESFKLLFGDPDPIPSSEIYDCSDEAIALLAVLEAAKTDLGNAKTALANANNTVEMLSQRFALKITKDGDADVWDAAIRTQLIARRELQAKQEALEKAKKPLSATYTYVWPSDRLPVSGELPFATRFGSEGKLAEPWERLVAKRPMLKPVLGEIDVNAQCSVSQEHTPLMCLSSHLDLTLHFVSDWPQLAIKTNSAIESKRAERLQEAQIPARPNFSTIDTTTGVFGGLLYREPARGGLVVCLKRKANGGTCSDDPLVKPQMVNFPQAGQMRFIPFKVLPFQGKDQSIEFSEDGYPLKIAIKSTKAAGAEAFSSGSEVVTSVAGALKKREEERRNDAKAARDAAVAELSTEIELLEKRAKIVTLNAPTSQPSEAGLLLTEIQADIELKRAQLLQMLLTQGITNGSIDPAILFNGS